MQAQVLRTVSFAEVYEGIGGPLLATLQITGGTVGVDNKNAVRRSLSSLTMVNGINSINQPLIVPQSAADILFPDGNEVVCYKGCLYPPYLSGAPTIEVPWINGGNPTPGEVVSMGRFLMDEVDVIEHQGSLTVVVQSGSDRSEFISRSTFTQPYSTDGSSPAWQAIQDILQLVCPSCPDVETTTGTQVPPVTSAAIGDDPWQFAQKIATACACDLFFDVNGVPQLELIPDPTIQQPAASYVEGPTCTAFSLQRQMSNANVPNWIIVMSSGSGVATPLRSDWQDLDPTSPTYLYGKYPQTVSVVNTSLATTQSQTDAMAAAAGYAQVGQLEKEIITVRCDPAIDADDVLGMTRTRAGLIDTLSVVDSIQFDLGITAGDQFTARRFQ